MIKRIYYIAAFLLFCSCSDQHSKYALLANIEASVDNTEQATITDLDAAMIDYPESIDLKIQKLKLLQKNNWETNEADFIASVIDVEVFNPVMYELVAKYYLAKNRIDKAFEITNLAEQKGANTASFYELKSLLYSRLGKYTESIDYINKAILLNRSDFKSYYTKGKIYLNIGDTSSAIKYMKIGLNQFKNNYEVLYEISDLYEKTKQYNEAEKLISNAILFEPKVEKLRIKHAEILLGQGKLYEAKKVLKASFIANNKNVKSALMLSDFYMKEYLHDSVIIISNQIIAADSLNVYALHNRAKSYDYKGFYTSSIKNYELIMFQDSLFENAKEEWQNVKTKRAYLQKFKDRKAAMPVFDVIAPKKN